jgi:hypothetical protein
MARLLDEKRTRAALISGAANVSSARAMPVCSVRRGVDCCGARTAPPSGCAPERRRDHGPGCRHHPLGAAAEQVDREQVLGLHNVVDEMGQALVIEERERWLNHRMKVPPSDDAEVWSGCMPNLLAKATRTAAHATKDCGDGLDGLIERAHIAVASGRVAETNAEEVFAIGMGSECDACAQSAPGVGDGVAGAAHRR